MTDLETIRERIAEIKKREFGHKEYQANNVWLCDSLLVAIDALEAVAHTTNFNRGTIRFAQSVLDKISHGHLESGAGGAK